MRTKFSTIITRCTLALAVLSAGAQLGPLHWAGDALALLSDVYIWAALLLLVGCLRLRAWRWAALAGLAVVLNGAQLAGYMRVTPAAPAAPIAETRNLRLLVHNIYYQNGDLDGVITTIKGYNPDIVFLMEYSEAIQGQIETAFADYPYRLIQPSRMTMGLALFSRVPIRESEVYRFQATRIPIYQVELLLDGKPFTFIGGHPWPPQPQWGELHRDQMREITRIAAQAQSPLIVAGDFNAVPWSYTVRQLAELTDTYHIQPGLDTARTWFPLPFFGLALDHVLVSEEWHVLSYRHGAQGGSDHMPIVVDLQLH